MISAKKVIEKSSLKKSDKIYINTLIPNFEFKNKIGKFMKSKSCCF